MTLVISGCTYMYENTSFTFNLFILIMCLTFFFDMKIPDFWMVEPRVKALTKPRLKAVMKLHVYADCFPETFTEPASCGFFYFFLNYYYHFFFNITMFISTCIYQILPDLNEYLILQKCLPLEDWKIRCF